MRKLLLIFGLVLISFQSLSAATRAEVNILEAAENIRYLSQKIAVDYFRLYINPQKEYLKIEIDNELEEMVSSIRTISIATNDEETKDILNFLTYSKEQIQVLLESKTDKEHAALMLDYSETLLEGASSITKSHTYNFNENEKMLMTGKNVEFLLERSAKYYLALGAGMDSDINKQQMKEAIDELESNLQKIKTYNYPTKLQTEKNKLGIYWGVIRSMMEQYNSMLLSNLVYLSTLKMKSMVDNFIIFHSKI